MLKHPRAPRLSFHSRIVASAAIVLAATFSGCGDDDGDEVASPGADGGLDGSVGGRNDGGVRRDGGSGSGGRGGRGAAGTGASGSSGRAGRGGTSGGGSGTGSVDPTGPIDGEPHTVTPMAGSVSIEDSSGTEVARVEWLAGAVMDDTMIGIAGGDLPAGLPATLEQVTGIALDLGGAEVALEVLFPVPADLNLDEYVLLLDTEDGLSMQSVAVRKVMAQSFVSTSARVSGTYSLVRLRPPEGCDEVHVGGGFSTDAMLAELAHVYRVKKNGLGLTINGTGVTTLESLRCLLVVDGQLQIQGTNITTTDGLDNMLGLMRGFSSGSNFTGNTRLERIALPAWFVEAPRVSGSPLLESVTMDALIESAVSITQSGTTVATTTVSMAALRRSESFSLEGNPALRDLDGFGALRRVDRALTLRDNESLTQIDGLSSLTTVGGPLSITLNAGLENVDGLSSLESAGNITIGNDALLESVRLPKLTELRGNCVAPAPGVSLTPACRGNIDLTANPVLALVEANTIEVVGNVTLNGNGSPAEPLVLHFDELAEFGVLTVSGNDGLRTLGGFVTAKRAATVNVTDNDVLKTLDGLQALEQLEALTIQRNPQLEIAPAFSELEEVMTINVSNNPLLTELSFPGLTALGTSITIGTNAGLTRLAFDALRSAPALLLQMNGVASAPTEFSFAMLETVTGALTLNGNAGLRNLDGFPELRAVGGAFSISTNAALTNIEGLASLTSVDQLLTISTNAALVDLDGLESLERCSGLTVGNNAALTAIDLPGLRTLNGSLSIMTNAKLASIAIDGVGTLTGLSVQSCGNLASGLSVSFAALRSVPGAFSFAQDPTLTSLSGFPMLQQVNSYSVRNNAMLPTCQAVALRDQIEAVNDIITVQIAANLADTCTP